MVPNLCALVLSCGVSIHLARLAFGSTWLIYNLVTPSVDMGLGVLITCCAAGLWLLRSKVRFAGRFDQIRYHAIALYFTGSVPIHLATFVTL